MFENKAEVRLLTADDIDVKVKQVTEKGATLLLYKNARIDMRILDDTFGSMNWQDDYKEIKGNLYCGIGVRESEEKPFVWKWDCGIESREDEGNEKKGEASDSFKRAGFKWGIGRELYTSPFVFAKVETVKDGNKYRLANPYEKFYVQEIDYIARKISKLVIINSKGEIVYTFGTKKEGGTTAYNQTPITNTQKPQTTQEEPKKPVNTPMTLDNANAIVLNFGRYKGEHLKDVPNDYLQWIIQNSTLPTLKKGAEVILEVRKEFDPEPDWDGNLPF